MAQLFITGGSGYLGRNLVPRLLAAGHDVRALARSEAAQARVRALGALPIAGDVDDVAALTEGMRGCDAVVHAAGRMGLYGPYDEFHRVNVTGTENVLAAARAAGTVRRLVYIGAAACVQGRDAVHHADESWPLQRLGYSPYPASKTLADERVRAASSSELQTCVLRPGWIWGPQDPITASMLAAARAGRMMLIDGGRHHIVTSHVDNVCHAIQLALARAAPGEAYFVFDDDGVELRAFIGDLLATAGLPPPEKRISYRSAFFVAGVLELLWRLLRRPGAPPIMRALVRLQGKEFTVSDRKARAALGYAPVISRADAVRALDG